MKTASGFEAARIRTLRPGLHVAESRVDDFDVRAVVVEGRDGILVWDTLAHPDQMAAVAPLLSGRIPTVAYSHADWDHVQGTAALGPVAEVVSHGACADRFLREVPQELAGRQAREGARWSGVRVVPPTRVFDDELTLDLGGVHVRLSHLPGHTADCVVAWIPAWGVLLAGDTVETPLPVVNDAAAVPGWAELLREWEVRAGLELVVPSHGRIGGADVIAETADYLERLMAGHAPALPPGTDGFYARTHRENVRLTGC